MENATYTHKPTPSLFLLYRNAQVRFVPSTRILICSKLISIASSAFATSFQSESIGFCPICHRSALTVTSTTRPSLQFAFKNLGEMGGKTKIHGEEEEEH